MERLRTRSGVMNLMPLSPLAVKLESLTMACFNLAGCVPSQEAPRHWNREIVTEHVRAEVLKNSPDILALQECPGGADWAQSIFGENYQVMGATHAHAGQVVLLVRKGISATPMPTSEPVNNQRVFSLFGSDIPFAIPIHRGSPAVLATLRFEDRSIMVSSVHLAPFGNGSKTRKSQVKQLLEIAGSTPLIFAGDTNMRTAEDKAMEVELGLLDAWKLAGSEKQTRFTWDTLDHTGVQGGSFNRYYGDDTRQYHARYDRIYCSKKTGIADIRVPSFELIANQPVTENNKHFLSDHFGISTVLEVQWEEQNAN